MPTATIGERDYDGNALDAQLANQDIEFIAPHRSMRRNIIQQGRALYRYCRRYCRRGKIELLFVYLQTFRRLLTRYERHIENFLAYV